jgi:hypothetical protein
MSEKVEKVYDVQQSIANQKKRIEEGKCPDFAPSNGICYSCRRQIYSPITQPSGRVTGVDVESAKYLVTGCPHCNRSYCD